MITKLPMKATARLPAKINFLTGEIGIGLGYAFLK